MFRRLRKRFIPAYTNSQMLALIDEHVHNERDRNIMRRRLIDGICYEPLAEEFDMSDRQIKVIVAKYEKILTKHLTVK